MLLVQINSSMSQRFRFHFRLVVLFVERDLISLWPGPNFIFKDINNQELFVSLLASDYCGLVTFENIPRDEGKGRSCGI